MREGPDEAPPAISVEVLEGFETFESLRVAWGDLHLRSAERLPTLSHAWTRAWWSAFGHAGVPRIVLAWRGATLRGALPLVLVAGDSGTVLRSLTNSWVDRSGLLVDKDDPEALESLLAAVVSLPGWERLELHARPDDGPLSSRIEEVLRHHRLLVGRDEELHSPFLRFGGGWSAVDAALSASFKALLRRKHRTVDRMDGMRMEIHRTADVIGPIMEISLASWQHESGTSMASDPSVRRFYESLMTAAAQDGTLYASLLTVAERPVAFEFNLLAGHTLHNFKLGYRTDSADWSPGLLLKTFTVRRFAEEFSEDGRTIEYDFMGTVEPYKLNWTDTIRTHHCLSAVRPTPRARLMHAWRYRAKPILRDRLPGVVAALKRLGARAQPSP